MHHEIWFLIVEQTQRLDNNKGQGMRLYSYLLVGETTR